MASAKPLSAADRRRLLAAARGARAKAYAPYSGFHVGASVLDDRGRVFAGCNVENGSSASSMCAEQAAVARAVSEGARRFRAFLVLAPAKEPLPPCGRCLQVLAEFPGDPAILMVTKGGRRREERLSALLPYPFRR
jgi:cytidine deaminase